MMRSRFFLAEGKVYADSQVSPARRACSPTALCLRAAFMAALVALVAGVRVGSAANGPKAVTDPGVRGGGPGAGGALVNLTTCQTTVFNDGSTNFTEVDAVATGLGPRFNSNQCSSCHSQPAVGGATANDLPGTGVTNPLFSIYQLSGAINTMPSFITTNGPILVARFPFQSDLVTPDGTVHQLFTITGRSDAQSCNIQQPVFASNNLALRQPIEMFGDGLLEIVSETDLTNNLNSNLAQKQALGIAGSFNTNLHDGTINRFGWKAQWRSLLLAAEEESNVEEGVTTESYPNELDETSGCVLNPIPEDGTNFNPTIAPDQFTGDPEREANFIKFLAPPVATPPTPSTTDGMTQFINIGCVLCHTQTFTTPVSSITALSQITFSPYTDLALHHMGNCLADNVVQDQAMGDMFRTAPLWGAGKRAFFMHDGRTSNIITAILDHADSTCTGSTGNGTYGPSEANAVIAAYSALGPQKQQDIINFLRSL